ncbi:cbb3-type cytochrome c oxidase subunit 3 [Variovorax sp. J22P168]|nr:cbb3-type cytochrome c oxidase subunit 3 [Variovorax sp. J22P168]MDM0014282.1 cbb3-type cytochrome c oxidase subunit 3 [Variovorax sp. J22P168]
MDIITTLRIVATLASFAIFIGIWLWAWSRRNKQAFEEAARLPFEEDPA